MKKKKSKARMTVEKNGVTFTDNGKVRVRVGKLGGDVSDGAIYAARGNPDIRSQIDAVLQNIAARTRKLEAEREARHQATLDAIVWGSGYLRVDTDGNIYRIDPRKIIVNIKGTEL